MTLAGAAHAAELPRIASINLCTDQLLMNLADPAQILGLSRDTVHEYVEAARRRYGVRRRTQLVLRAVRDGHLNIDALL